MRPSNEPTPDRPRRQSKHRPIISPPITVPITVRQVVPQVTDRNLLVKLIRLVIRANPMPKISLKVLRTRKPRISPAPSPIHPSQIRQQMLSVSRQPIRQIHRQIKIITHSPAIARNITDRPTPPNPKPLNQPRRLSQHLKQHSSPRRRLKALSQSRLASLVILHPAHPHRASPHLINRHLVNRQALVHGLVQEQKFLKLLPNKLLNRLHPRFLIRRPLADRVLI